MPVDLINKPATLTLVEQIRRSLSQFLSVSPQEIIVPLNVEKYYERTDPTNSTSTLEEVFRLMWALNQIGITDGDLGRGLPGTYTLSDALTAIVKDVVVRLDGAPVQYTELGPEPSKTRFILRRLRDQDVKVIRYAGVDINPASKATMREQLADLLAEDGFTYHQVLFQNFARTQPATSGHRQLVTMLGFEEGNEHPEVVDAMLDGILKPGDLFLSEMQLLSGSGWYPIFRFYQTRHMQQFSKLALHRNWPDVTDSSYGVYLVPLTLFDDAAPTMAAVTAETAQAPGGGIRIFVTNYCLKLTSHEYRRVREMSGKFRVLSQRATGDGSIAFQLAEKL